MLSSFQNRLCRVLSGVALGALLACAAQGRIPAAARSSSLWQSPWAVADLDGDHRPDFATSSPERASGKDYLYRVDLQLSSVTEISSFTVASTDSNGVDLFLSDVDGDDDLDLIITTGIGRRLIGVWINNGHGLFTPADRGSYVPSTYRDSPAALSSADKHGGEAVSPDRRDPLILACTGGWLSANSFAVPCAGQATDFHIFSGHSLPSRAPPPFFS